MVDELKLLVLGQSITEAFFRRIEDFNALRNWSVDFKVACKCAYHLGNLKVNGTNSIPVQLEWCLCWYHRRAHAHVFKRFEFPGTPKLFIPCN